MGNFKLERIYKNIRNLNECLNEWDVHSNNFIGQEMNEEYAAVNMWELQNWLKDMGIS